MRVSARLGALLIVLAGTGCAFGPTEQEISESLERTLRSVSGNWHATTFGANPMTLKFRLQEGRNGTVTGTGTLKESGVHSVVPIAVFGTYRRPRLALTLVGQREEGEHVQGTLAGDYSSVGGISTTLKLTSPGDPPSARAVAILLQEE